MRRVHTGFLVMSLVAVGFVLGASAPAHACSCIARTEAQQVDTAEVVFRGVVTDKVLPLGTPQSSLDPVEYTFDVEQVFKGSATTPQRATSAVSSASCGVELEVGGRYLVFADSETGQLTLSLCGGTRPAGPGEAPAGDPPAPPPDPSQPPIPVPGTPNFAG